MDGEQVPVRGVATNECPVSLITSTSRALIGIHTRASTLKDVGFAGDASELPAKLVDGLEQVAVEVVRAENTIKDAIWRKRNHQQVDLQDD